MSWQQLVELEQEGRELDREEAAKVPVDCPQCGTVLASAPAGGLFCPFTDHYFWPEQS